LIAAEADDANRAPTDNTAIKLNKTSLTLDI
jgi:hypothetical protein